MAIIRTLRQEQRSPKFGSAPALTSASQTETSPKSKELEMKLAAIAFSIMVTASAVFAQSPPTLRIVTEDPNLPSELFYGDTKVKPLRLRPGTNTVLKFEDNDYFVFQQYVDFLLRMPDRGGFDDWNTVLEQCGPNHGGLGSDPACDRVHVSSGFFRSTEFGERGYWAYRYYHAALGRRPQFAEFVPDLRQLSGFVTPAQEEASRNVFVTSFMQRPEFAAIYANLTNPANAANFIAKLEEKAQVTLPATVPPTQTGQPPQYGRQELIDKMATGQFTAGQTLRAFIEQKVVFDAFFFRAFVAMQYFGYLLRDPEDAGYNDWVDVLTNGRGTIPAGDFRHLIFGFVWSVEYRQRFGPP